jgi:hypothetical protein
MMCIWRVKLPLKVKIFLWQVCNDKIQLAEQLKAKYWNGPLECKLCGEIESTSHIFLECVVAMFSWRLVSDVVGWSSPPSNMMDLHSKLVEGSNRDNNSFVFLLAV